jgi:protein O-mannosyl-transferase
MNTAKMRGSYGVGYEGTVLKQILLLLALLFIVYSNTLDNGFVWDDIPLIERNPRVHSLKYLPSHLTAPFFDQPDGLAEGRQYPYWRPLTLLSLSLDYAAWGNNPFGYHITNLLLHALNAVLALLIFRLIPATRRAAFIGALIFALHPLQTTPVAYISGRTYLLAASFFLCACVLFLRRITTENAGAACTAGMALCVALSLMATEMVFAAPFLLLLLSVMTHRPFARRSIEAAIAAAAAVAGYVVCRSLLNLPMTGWLASTGLLSARRLLAVAESLMLYGRLALLPVGLHMERFMDLPPASDPMALWCAAAALLIAAATAYGVRRRNLQAYLLCWSFLALLPASNIIPIYPDIAARQIFLGEHFLYLPLVALSMIGALAWRAATDHMNRWSSLMRVAGVSVLALFGTLTYAHNEYWKDEATLYSLTLKRYPGSVRMCTNLAIVYAREGRFEESLRLLRTVANQNPLSDLTHCRLAAVYYNMGKLDLVREELTRALTISPHSAAALDGLGMIDHAGGRIDNAIAYYKMAIDASPLYLPPRLNLAMAYLDKGETERALQTLRDALSIDPDSIEARTRLATIHEKQGRAEEAAAQYRILFARHPECATALPTHGRAQR